MTVNPRKNLNDYARYSSIAIQMLAIILVGVFSGFKLDQWLQTKPILTVIFSIVSVSLSIYFVTKDLLRK
jgi:F0F1-type ATP synthase assembly protein I